MRVMRLPEAPPRPSSVEDCLAVYIHRLPEDVVPHPQMTASLLGYMGWPNDQTKRSQWMATAISHHRGPHLLGTILLASTPDWAAFRSFGGLEAVTSVAFQALAGELAEESAHWS